MNKARKWRAADGPSRRILILSERRCPSTVVNYSNRVGAANQVVVPDELSIDKDQTVTFVSTEAAMELLCIQ